MVEHDSTALTIFFVLACYHSPQTQPSTLQLPHTPPVPKDIEMTSYPQEERHVDNEDGMSNRAGEYTWHVYHGELNHASSNPTSMVSPLSVAHADTSLVGSNMSGKEISWTMETCTCLHRRFFHPGFSYPPLTHLLHSSSVHQHQPSATAITVTGLTFAITNSSSIEVPHCSSSPSFDFDHMSSTTMAGPCPGHESGLSMSMDTGTGKDGMKMAAGVREKIGQKTDVSATIARLRSNPLSAPLSTLLFVSSHTIRPVYDTPPLPSIHTITYCPCHHTSTPSPVHLLGKERHTYTNNVRRKQISTSVVAIGLFIPLMHSLFVCACHSLPRRWTGMVDQGSLPFPFHTHLLCLWSLPLFLPLFLHLFSLPLHSSTFISIPPSSSHIYS